MTAFALLILLAQPAAHTIAGITHVQQGEAPFCAAAAGLMGASRIGPIPELLPFVRALPVAVDGIPWLELAEALRPLGTEARVVLMTYDELRTALAADIPVILAVRASRGRHAVLATGYEGERFEIHDPALPTPVHWDRPELVRRWSGRQAVVLMPLAAMCGPDRPVPCADPRLPLGDWRAQDARYRALEWALRAERLETPSADMLALYDRAVEAAPTIAPIRYNRARVRFALGQAEGGCADLRAATAADGRWLLPASAAAAAGCPPAAMGEAAGPPLPPAPGSFEAPPPPPSPDPPPPAGDAPPPGSAPEASVGIDPAPPPPPPADR